MNTTRKSQTRRVIGLTAGLLAVSALAAAPASAHNERTITIGDARLCEGNSGLRQLRFSVQLDQPATEPVSVSFLTANGSAQAASDFQAKSGVVTFPAGYSAMVVSVPLIGDTLDEGNETMNVLLANAQHATIADAVGVGTIVDEDPFPVLSISDGALQEPDSGTALMTFRAILDCNTTSNVTVTWASGNGSAVADSDYVAGSGSATILAGASMADIKVAIRGDLVREANETFNVFVGSPNAVLGDSLGVGVITNDD